MNTTSTKPYRLHITDQFEFSLRDRNNEAFLWAYRTDTLRSGLWGQYKQDRFKITPNHLCSFNYTHKINNKLFGTIKKPIFGYPELNVCLDTGHKYSFQLIKENINQLAFMTLESLSLSFSLPKGHS